MILTEVDQKVELKNVLLMRIFQLGVAPMGYMLSNEDTEY